MADTEKPKATKIVDVTHPDKVAAGAGARPVLITNRPMATDPMVVSAETSGQAATKLGSVEPQQLQHQERVLLPPTPRDTEEKSVAETENDKEVRSTADAADQEDAKTLSEPEAHSPSSEPDDELEIDSQADEDKQVRKAEQAVKEDEARQAILEDLIEKGTYAVPINAVKRERSRKLAILAMVVAVVAVVVGGALVLRFVFTDTWNHLTKFL